MLDFLREPIWLVIVALIGSAALLGSGLAGRRQRRKALTYQQIAVAPLLSVRDELKGLLEIRYAGQSVEQVHLILLKLVNTGTLPIVSTDFVHPVTITLGATGQILTLEVAEASPANLGASLTPYPNGRALTVDPLLLNAGDWLTVKILISQYGGPIRVDGRIVGVKSIQQFTPRPNFLLLYFYFTSRTIIAMGIVAVVVWIITSMVSGIPQEFGAIVLGLTIILLGGFLMLNAPPIPK